MKYKLKIGDIVLIKQPWIANTKVGIIIAGPGCTWHKISGPAWCIMLGDEKTWIYEKYLFYADCNRCPGYQTESCLGIGDNQCEV